MLMFLVEKPLLAVKKSCDVMSDIRIAPVVSATALALTAQRITTVTQMFKTVLIGF